MLFGLLLVGASLAYEHYEINYKKNPHCCNNGRGRIYYGEAIERRDRLRRQIEDEYYSGKIDYNEYNRRLLEMYQNN